MWQDIICKQEYISYCCVDFWSMSNDLCYHSDKKTTAVHNFLNFCGEEVRLALTIIGSFCLCKTSFVSNYSW